MSLIISIDTSTKVCSVALHQEGKLLASGELFAEKSHSGRLTMLIAQMVENAGFTLGDLEAIAVAKGPGSYTGLRIGVSTAKGLAFALDKPLLSVNTLEAMVTQIVPFFPKDYWFCPMLDARRMEVYCGIWDSSLTIVQQTQAKIIDETSFEELLDERCVVFFGDGAAKCKQKIAHPNALFLATDIHPSAKTIGVLAWEAYQQQAFENVVSFEPFYLKDFVGTMPKSK